MKCGKIREFAMEREPFCQWLLVSGLLLGSNMG